jgi:lysophospholipase L1-like esterase
MMGKPVRSSNQRLPMSSRRPGIPRVRLTMEALEERLVLTNASYVTGLGVDLLHRSPAPVELWSWVQLLDTGVTGQQLASALVASPEYQAGLVQADYQLFLRRPPEAAAQDGWLAALQAGLGPEQFAADLLGSDEYFIAQGGNDASWLQGVFRDVLHRPIDPSAAAAWGQLLAHGASRAAVAYGIVTSPEAGVGAVSAAYQSLLGRAPGAAELVTWVGLLGQGLTSDGLRAAVAGSEEFAALQGGLDDPIDATATLPSPIAGVGNDYWTQREADNENEVAQGFAPILFLGDSITDGFANGPGAPVWNATLAPLGAVDFGIGGLTTSEVLWQVEDGQVAAVAPKVAVLMIGTNNLAPGHSPAGVAEGIAEIVDLIRVSSPGTKVLLLGIFPRAFSPADPLRAAIAQVNALIPPLADNQHVWYLDIGNAFLQPDGSISPAVMLDGVHPTLLGYEIWQQQIWPTLNVLDTGP